MNYIESLSFLPWHNNQHSPDLAFTKPLRMHAEGTPCPHAPMFEAFPHLQGSASCCALNGIAVATAMYRLAPELVDPSLNVHDPLAAYRGAFFRLSARDASNFSEALIEAADNYYDCFDPEGKTLPEDQLTVTICLPPEDGGEFRTWRVPHEPLSLLDAGVILFATSQWLAVAADRGFGVRHEWS